MDNSSANIDLIRSHVDIIILKPLESHDRYGYEILKEIETNSNGLFKLKQPTLYSCLKRLEKQGYINSYLGDESNGAQRRYYSLTQQGRDFLASQQAQWEFVRTILSGLVSDVEFDKDKDVQPFDPSKYRPLTKRTRNEDEQPEVKVVEKIVYVPTEAEPQKLSKEEIREQLSEDDIQDIVDDYLKTHPTKSENSAEEIDNSYVDDYIDDMASKEPPIKDNSFFTDYSTMLDHNDAVEEDVAIMEDDNINDNSPAPTYNDNAYTEEDIQPITVESYENEQVLDELTTPQSNNIKEDEADFIEEKPSYTRETVTIDDLFEEKPRYASFANRDDFTSYNERNTSVTASDDDLVHYSPMKEGREEKDDNVASVQPRQVVFEEKPVFEEPIKQDEPVKEDNSQLFDYSRRINTAKKENKTEETINVFKALDRIYADANTEDEPPVEEVIPEMRDDRYDSRRDIHYNTTNSEDNHVETISELKSKLQGEGFKVKPYTRINSSEFYVNNYYYANRTARDTSLIMFAIFFIESMLAHFILATKFELNFGYLALTWAIAALVPIFFTVKWAISPYYKKHTRVSLRLSLMLGLIFLLNAALIIFLAGFFGFGADYNNVDTMILPIITPLVFLLNIPLYSVIYYLLYKTKRYNLR